MGSELSGNGLLNTMVEAFEWGITTKKEELNLDDAILQAQGDIFNQMPQNLSKLETLYKTAIRYHDENYVRSYDIFKNQRKKTN